MATSTKETGTIGSDRPGHSHSRETARDGIDARRTAHSPATIAYALMCQYGQKNRPAAHYERRATWLRTR
jgi:hypothetical protein